MIAKWVADSTNVGGIYAIWLAMRRYIWLPQTEFRDSGRTCEEYLKPSNELAVIDNQNCTIHSLGRTHCH
jgi:chloride channel 3/4/5